MGDFWRETLRVLSPPNRSLGVAFHAMAVLWNAGMPISRIFGTMGSLVREEDLRLGQALDDVQSKVNTGLDVGSALLLYPSLFGSTNIQAIRNAQVSGTMAKVAEMLSELEQQWFHTRWQIYQALVYPVVMLLATGLLAFVVLPYLVVSMLPNLTSSGQLPWITGLVLRAAQMMRSLPFWCCVAGATWLGTVICNRPELRNRVQAQVERLPILGTALRAAAYHGFFASLQLSVSSGVKLSLALNGAASASGNVELMRKMRVRVEEMKEGEVEFAQVFADFEPFAVSLLKTATQAGAFDRVLALLTRHYQQVLELSIQSALALLNPLLTLVMGILVGGVVVATALPLTSMTEALL